MDSPILIRDNIYWVGTNDRETDLFEGIWPLPQGVAYNAYLILDRKTVLIDTVKKTNTSDFLIKLKTLLGEHRKLDYLIINHLEPDHSGSLKILKEAFPGLKLIGNKKTAEFLSHLYHINDQVQVIQDGETLELGEHKLCFFLAPMVHWPETMVTYEQKNKILFSCDAFGGFAALDSGIFDDQINIDSGEGEMLRYYSNIVGKYSVMVQKALAKLKDLDIKIIAPSHGPIWRSNPQTVLNRYDRWSKYEAEPGVMLAFGSMYGNTNKLMEAVCEGLGKEGIKQLVIHDVSRSHHSYILRDAWRYKAFLLGAPAYDTKLYPPMANLIDLFERKTLKNRLVGIFGSYGWSGGGVSTLSDFLKRVNWELIEPIVEVRFSPTQSDLEKGILLGQNMAKAIASSDIP